MACDCSYPLVSVCVPVYNVASYVEQCARSLFEQTYPCIEYIFVNDGSTDDSMRRLTQVASHYPEARIRFLENERNHGLAYTRRRSIEEASGEYICCVDSDDWVETNMVERLVGVARDRGWKVVEAGYLRHNCQHVEHVLPVGSKGFEDVIRDLTRNFIWGKLYHRSLFETKTVFAPEGLDYLEDRHVLTRLRYYHTEWGVLNECLYHYRCNREGSVATQKKTYHFACLVRFYAELEGWLEGEGEMLRYQEVVARQKVQDKVSLMLYCRDRSTIRRCANLFREEEKRFLYCLQRSRWIVGHLVYYHLWRVLAIYQRYLDWRQR